MCFRFERQGAAGFSELKVRRRHPPDLQLPLHCGYVKLNHLEFDVHHDGERLAGW